jgi:hypothetical protein
VRLDSQRAFPLVRAPPLEMVGTVVWTSDGMKFREPSLLPSQMLRESKEKMAKDEGASQTNNARKRRRGKKKKRRQIPSR